MIDAIGKAIKEKIYDGANIKNTLRNSKSKRDSDVVLKVK